MIQGKSRMRETRPYGSVRGATRKNGPYRDIESSTEARKPRPVGKCYAEKPK